VQKLFYQNHWAFFVAFVVLWSEFSFSQMISWVGTMQVFEPLPLSLHLRFVARFDRVSGHGFFDTVDDVLLKGGICLACSWCVHTHSVT
jgi:hypothetical protein